MRCLNNCPNRAIEAAHGMGFLFWFIYAALSTQLSLVFVRILDIYPQIWWWKIASLIISILVMLVTISILYRLIHYLMAWKPFEKLIRNTSLTALPFWRRYHRKTLKKT
jgi:membrane protein YdbS with pleckstrin-like domain